jgi:hypothetical protein
MAYGPLYKQVGEKLFHDTEPRYYEKIVIGFLFDDFPLLQALVAEDFP